MAALRQTLSRWAGAEWAAPWSHLPFLLFIVALLAYGGGFAAMMLSNFDGLDLAVTTRDDGFYYFQIAWNMAQGRFSTFDGGITQTNGYHPLWLFLITPFYWFLDKESALFAIRALEIMLIAGGVAVIAVAARLCRLPWWLLVAALPLLYRQPALFFGMEAAAALLMLGLLFLGLALFVGNPARWKGLLAAICFALPWVRLEYVAISLAVAAVLCLFEFPQWRRAPGGGGRAGLRSFHALAPLVGAVAGILVYFAYNGLVFGGIVPVSGATKALWSQYRWNTEGGYSFADNLAATLQIPVFDWELLAAAAVCLWLLPVWWLARRAENGPDRLLFAFMLGAFGLAVGHLAMFGYNVVAVHPALQAISDWYFVPGYLLMALLVPLHGYLAAGLLRRWFGPRWPRAAKLLPAAVLLAAAALLVWQADFAYPRRSVNPPPPDAAATLERIRLSRYAGALMVNRGLPEGSVIGSWDAGVIGYFSRFPVVNLDGLVNSYDYRRAAGPGEIPPRWLARNGGTPPMLRQFGITHLANDTNSYFGAGLTPWEDRIFEGRWYSVDGKFLSRFNVRTPETDYDAGAAFGEAAAAAAGPSDSGGRLTATGRLAQAVVSDCPPDGLLVWVYANGEGAPLKFPATTAYHSPDGWCAAALAARHGAPLPARVEVRPAGDYLAQRQRRRPPEAEAAFAVYFIQGPPGIAPQLLYAQDECRPEDLESWFFLHLIPRSVSDLPAGRQEYGYANADFRFHHLGGQFGDWCLAAIPLNQDYPISRIRTGQWIAEEERRLWEVEFPLPP